ncbi:MAG: YfcE family phosphodiesterase [Candidatus Altiarchaeales archaeon]|nr:YfcE family phosphodiesterase [Candidatus Altiarchaeales archaeon]MBD3417158.1 YfcE family phosphodiesterase [Candidatus Altiarchaeales archaeon]
MIGVMADSHDNIEAIEKALEFFKESGVDMVIHGGDIVSPFTVESFKKIDCEIRAVCGNNEGDLANLNKKFEELDVELSDFLEFQYDEVNIAVYHGHNPSILDSIVKSAKYDVVVTAHTHTPEVTLEENTLVVNPGETCGYLTGVRTVALLDIKEMKADIREL